ncbi:MAG: hypothetical protein WC870_02315 [Candidatus Paceibacterota bacterium]
MNLEHIRHFSEEYDIPNEEMEGFVSKADLPILPEDLENLCAGNEELQSLYEGMVQKCFEYTADVFKLKKIAEENVSLRDEEWRINLQKADQDRRILHEATMDSINILGRNLKKEGKSNEWLRTIAGERSRYTRFAIAFAFSYYLFLRRKEEQ